MFTRYAVLWHGTSKSRADSIARTGFYPNSFFASAEGISWRYASARQKQDDPGVLVLCAVDLTSYKKSEYERRKSGLTYYFRSSVPKDSIAGIFRIDKSTQTDLKKEADRLKRMINRHHIKSFEIRRDRPQRFEFRKPQVVITRNCNEEAIAYWINAYLSMRTNRRIKVVHPGIVPIRMWVEMNYANGRISPISDREMLMQVMRYVPGLFKDTRSTSMRA